MAINVTSRHFKAHSSLVEYAKSEVEKLNQFYDGIIRGEVILNFEKIRNSTKIAEINISVYNATLTAKHGSDDFHKSIDKAVAKLEIQLKKYKDKLRAKDRQEVRKVRSKS